jgi:gamma-butyrobetaine dioxygenase
VTGVATVRGAKSAVRPTGTAAIDGSCVILGRPSGGRMTLPAIWLRHNCPCTDCRHPNGQRLIEFLDIPADIAPRSARLDADGTLEVVWNADGHVSRYDAGWLTAHSLAPTARVARRKQPLLWGAELATRIPRADWAELCRSPAAERQALQAIVDYGFLILSNVPTTSGAVVEVGNRLGHVRVTNYGVHFDVRSVPNPNNLAFTAAALGVHTDNPYRDPTPGLQLLHCLEADAPGGDTILVDGFKAAEDLRAQDPTAFSLLSWLPVDFRFADADADLAARVPVVSVDSDGQIIAVHFNNRSMAPLDAPEDMIAPWYAAYRKFATLLRRPEAELTLRLAPGDLMVMSNIRTMHGRTAFDVNAGRRHLQGCYVDLDGLESRLRVLSRGRNADPIAEIEHMFARRGDEGYGEGVTQTEHALQAAHIAESEGKPVAQVVAALLHDIGHLLHDLPEDIADQGVDTQHESLASAWLSQHFGPEVSEPVRLHVAAKRYLCHAEQGYLDRLSEASKLSLRLQGGPMNAAEAARFRQEPFLAQALDLRRWDDEAKVVGATTPDLAHYRPAIEAALKR